MEKQNMKKKITNYEAPQLTVVEFRMENGFALSSWSATAQQIQMFAEQQQEIVPSEDGQLVGGYMDGQAIDNSNPTGGSGWEYENGGWF